MSSTWKSTLPSPRSSPRRILGRRDSEDLDFGGIPPFPLGDFSQGHKRGERDLHELPLGPGADLRHEVGHSGTQADLESGGALHPQPNPLELPEVHGAPRSVEAGPRAGERPAATAVQAADEPESVLRAHRSALTNLEPRVRGSPRQVVGDQEPGEPGRGLEVAVLEIVELPGTGLIPEGPGNRMEKYSKKNGGQNLHHTVHDATAPFALPSRERISGMNVGALHDPTEPSAAGMRRIAGPPLLSWRGCPRRRTAQGECASGPGGWSMWRPLARLRSILALYFIAEKH